MKEPPRGAVAGENLARGHGSGKWIGQQQNEPRDCSYDVSRNKYSSRDHGPERLRRRRMIDDLRREVNFNDVKAEETIRRWSQRQKLVFNRPGPPIKASKKEPETRSR
jgi:hypothetical protein